MLADALLVNNKSAKKKEWEKRRKLFCSVSYLDRQGIHQRELKKVQLPGHDICVLLFFTRCLCRLNVICSVRSNAYTATFPFQKFPCYPGSVSWHTHTERYCVGIFKQSMGIRNRVGIGLSYLSARLHRLAELNPWYWFLGSFKGRW